MRKAAVGSALALVAALLAGALRALPFFENVELELYDMRVRATADPDAARPDIALITIDEASIQRFEGLVGRWPWPRLIHASVIDFLARAPARVVVYDVLFTERDRRGSFAVGDTTWTGADSDAALAESTRRAGRVVHVADVAANELRDPRAASDTVTPAGSANFTIPGFEERPSIAWPFAELAAASRLIGHNLLVLDSDGPVRRHVPFVRVKDRALPSLAVAASLVAVGLDASDVSLAGDVLRLGTRAVPLVRKPIPTFEGESRESRRGLIAFQGVHENGEPAYRTYSFYDVFYAEQQVLEGEKPHLDPAAFRDQVVIIGTSAPGLHDVFTVPFAGGVPGAEVHATVIDNLLSTRFMRPAGTLAAAAAVIACAAIVGVAGATAGPWIGSAVGAVALVALAWAGLALFARGLWLEATAPALSTVVALFGVVGYHYLVEGREKRRVKKLFSRFVPRDVFAQLMHDPSRARLGGERREMTVLFSDIRGFTSVSERGQPEDIVAQLNEYFTRMVDVLFAHRGTLDKFVGDMVMALFGAPLDDGDHADHAVEAALAMAAELERLNDRWQQEGRPRLGIGIGINTGEMVAGMIGSEAIMSYTVIGDAVNLGARLESLNKEYGTRIIISETTRSRLKGRYDIHSLGEVTVKGKTLPVTIYEVRSCESSG